MPPTLSEPTKADLLKTQSTFAYTTAGRLFLVLYTVLFIYFLAFLKILSDDNVHTRERGVRLQEGIDSLEKLLPSLPKQDLKSVDGPLKIIKSWGIGINTSVTQTQCDNNGTFVHFFFPGETEVGIRTLLDRFKKAVAFATDDSKMDKDPMLIYPSQFILMGNAGDSSLLANNYHHPGVADSSLQPNRKSFGPINLQKYVATSPLVQLDSTRWFRNLEAAREIWDDYNNRYPAPFTLNGLKILATNLRSVEPRLAPIDLAAGIKLEGTHAFYLLGTVVCGLLFFTRWFLKKAQDAEQRYNTLVDGLTFLSLSSIASGIFFFLQSYKVTNPIQANNNQWLFPVKLFIRILVSLPFLVIVVLLPTAATILLPYYMAAVTPEGWQQIFVGCSYAVAMIALGLSISIFLMLRCSNHKK